MPSRCRWLPPGCRLEVTGVQWCGNWRSQTHGKKTPKVSTSILAPPLTSSALPLRWAHGEAPSAALLSSRTSWPSRSSPTRLVEVVGEFVWEQLKAARVVARAAQPTLSRGKSPGRSMKSRSWTRTWSGGVQQASVPGASANVRTGFAGCLDVMPCLHNGSAWKRMDMLIQEATFINGGLTPAQWTVGTMPVTAGILVAQDSNRKGKGTARTTTSVAQWPKQGRTASGRAARLGFRIPAATRGIF